MWSDELDNKMKEATGDHYPAYNDKAWDKMEVLLDKHLPQKKKRRRFIFLLLPLLLVGTGIFLLVQKREKNSTARGANIPVKSGSVKMQTDQGTTAVIPTESVVSESTVIPKQPGKIKSATEMLTENSKPKEINAPKQTIKHDASFTDKRKIKEIASRDEHFKPRPSFEKNDVNHTTKGQENKVRDQQPSTENTTATAAEKSNLNNSITPLPIDTVTSFTQIAQSAGEKKQPDSSGNKNEITEAKSQKQKNSPGSKLSLNLSAGPDISSIGIDNPGKWNLQYGIGFSYAVSKRLSIRTGFFAGRKKYSADSTEYHSDYYPPKLEKIDANCLVYEIPVNLVYNFPAAKRHNWFIAGGVSSYLMKKETYDYFYKNAWGQSQYYSHTYKNENVHLFSVINISGGYQYRFTDRLSMMAEPYVRIPVSGIGSGRVKLNSGGVLFSIGFKPFLKKK